MTKLLFILAKHATAEPIISIQQSHEAVNPVRPEIAGSAEVAAPVTDC